MALKHATVFAALLRLASSQKCLNQTLDDPLGYPLYNTVPSPGGPGFDPIAAPWNSSSCCTATYSQILQRCGFSEQDARPKIRAE
jgi:hypothetical protein